MHDLDMPKFLTPSFCVQNLVIMAVFSRRVHIGHPMRIEPDRIRFERVHAECAFAQSGSDPD